MGGAPAGGVPVFKGLGYARPEKKLAKCELAHRISKVIERRLGGDVQIVVKEPGANAECW